MTVKCAKERIDEISKICEQTVTLCRTMHELDKETKFLYQAVAILNDYKESLEKAIEKAEIDI